MSDWKILSSLKQTQKKEKEEEIINVLLKNRGINSSQDKKLFFNPAHPSKLTLNEVGISESELKKGVKRIIKAIKNNEFIVVYGDYDADGICATAILWETLHKYHKGVMPYLPNRIDEGYGLSKKGIDNIVKEYSPKLIITVDHGVTASEEIEYAKEKGIDIIVSDHHVIPKKKPKPYALIHTTKVGGAGVSLFLAREFLKDTNVEEKLSLCAIGTVSDVLPLIGVNRSIVSYGLEELKKTTRVGLKALFSEAGIKQTELSTYHLGYIIGPRINASGRITHALDSLRLLCTKSSAKARELALLLSSTNRQRQKITETTLLHARGFVVKNYGLSLTKSNKLLFVYDDSYNQGIIGLVAGRLVEEFYRPTIVLSVGKTYAKASARSISGFNIISAIRETQELLIDCGGHPMAAGFTVETVKIERLKKKLNSVFKEKLADNLLIRVIKVDCEISLTDITSPLYDKLTQFQPFGPGNPEPLFTTKGLQVKEARLVGRDRKHLKLVVEDTNGNQFNAIAFGLSSFYPKLTKDGLVNIVYSITKNDWNGERLELKIRDIKF